MESVMDIVTDKIKIVFVDDEPSILQGMRRMLRGHRDKWDMSFFESGDEVIEHFSKERVHAIVSDMRMPGMSGADLLNWVKKEHPDVVRIALSGYSDSQMTLESLGATHQFISKPAEPGQIESALIRTLKLRRALSDKEVVKVITGMGGIPSLPASYHQLMDLIAKDDFGIDEVGAIVERDMALSASLLKIVNSAFFGFYGHVESPSQAVSMLGIQTVKNLAVSEQVFSHFKSIDIDVHELTKLNEASQKVAGLASRFAKSINMNKQSVDHCQIAGLLCHLGDFVCMTLLRDLESIKSGELRPQVIAGHILALWGLPDNVVEAVVFHQKPIVGFGNELLPVHVVHAAWSLLKDGGSDKSAEKGSDEDLANDKKSTLKQLVNEKVAENWLEIYFENIDTKEQEQLR